MDIITFALQLRKQAAQDDKEPVQGQRDWNSGTNPGSVISK